MSHAGRTAHASTPPIATAAISVIMIHRGHDASPLAKYQARAPLTTTAHAANHAATQALTSQGHAAIHGKD